MPTGSEARSWARHWPGSIVVVQGDGQIPYIRAAASIQEENAKHWIDRDPELKCYLPGIPRATYMPYPFQILQTPRYILFTYEYANSNRVVRMEMPSEAPVDTWMGWSTGRWEGNTLVVDVTSFNDQTWFDRAGNFHSDALHVIERFARAGPDHITYEVTIEDPKVFSKPWKMTMPLYRRQEKNFRLLEYDCYAYMEEEAGKGNLKLPWTHLGFEGRPEK